MPDFKSTDFPSLFPVAPAPAGRRGRQLEELVKRSTAGVYLTHIPQSARKIPIPGKPGGPKEWKVVAVRGPVDFMGTLVSGRAIVFDAKESRLAHRLKTDEDHLSKNQWSQLIGHGSTGAVAGLLVMRTSDLALFWCDWRLLRKPSPSIAYALMTRVGSGMKGIDWSAVVKAAEGVAYA